MKLFLANKIGVLGQYTLQLNWVNEPHSEPTIGKLFLITIEQLGFRNTDALVGNEVKIWQNLQVQIFYPAHPRSM